MPTTPPPRKGPAVVLAGAALLVIVLLLGMLAVQTVRATAAPSSPATFKAATWNVYYGTPTRRLAPVLDQLLDDDVSVLLMQEAGGHDVTQLLRSRGLHTYAVEQYRVAWDPARWRAVDRHALTLSSTTYYSRTMHRWQPTRAVAVTLVDRVTGRRLEALSYHTPSAVQCAHPLPFRRLVLRQAMSVLGARAALELSSDAELDAVLYAGDDNVDERGAFGPWGFLHAPATGLQLVQPPAPTHAGGRRIDDFRVRRLIVGRGLVLPGGGDHRVHVRGFGWAR